MNKHRANTSTGSATFLSPDNGNWDALITHLQQKYVCKIEPTSPATHYHELRKTCKKLRYLMEFFTSLIPKKRNMITAQEHQAVTG